MGECLEMGYLTRNKEKRYDPRLLVEGTKSIVTVLYNYYPKQRIGDSDRFKIAKYAYGADYHDVLKRKMRQLLEGIEAQTGKLEGTRLFVDSAPVLDRAWAVRCGLGFIGKNTTLIHPKKGSFFFIGHLFYPLHLPKPAKTFHQPLRTMHEMLGRLPYWRFGGSLPHRRSQVHLLPDHRIQRQPWRYGSQHLQRLDVWLRHLPRCVSLQSFLACLILNLSFSLRNSSWPCTKTPGSTCRKLTSRHYSSTPPCNAPDMKA